MATTQSPSNSYHAVIGQPGNHADLIPFTAPSLGVAQTVAQSFATILGVAITLQALETQPGNENVYTPGSQGGTVSAPTGIAWSSR